MQWTYIDTYDYSRPMTPLLRIDYDAALRLFCHSCTVCFSVRYINDECDRCASCGADAAIQMS